MNKMDLALNNLQWLICHKTKPKTLDIGSSVVYSLYSVTEAVEIWVKGL